MKIPRYACNKPSWTPHNPSSSPWVTGWVVGGVASFSAAAPCDFSSHILKFLFLILVLAQTNAINILHAAEYGSVTVSEIRSIYDGDTFKVNIDHWPTIVEQSISLQVQGVDTPELRGKCQAEKDAARAAKKFTVAMLRAGEVIELGALERDKYFRLLADVWVDEKSLGDALIKSGHAVPYKGGMEVS